MTLSIADRAYDLRVTVGRGVSEMHLFEIGYWLGALDAYLDEGFVIEQRDEAEESDWYHQASFDEAIGEGAAFRDDHTAEDLFIWAHDWMAGRVYPGGS